MAMDRATALAVAAEAHAAAAAGKTEADCPYDADGKPEERFKARYWTLGFQQSQEPQGSQGSQEDSAGR